MKAFIIYLPDREHSVTHSAYMLKTLHSYGINAELFEGTTGGRAVKLADKDNKVLYPFSIKSQQLVEHEIKEYIKPELWDEFRKEFHYTIHRRKYVGQEDIPKLSRPGVIGCFYSHYNLWKKCIELDQPIMIFEDDVKFYRKYEPVDFEGVLVLSLGKTSFMREPQKTYLENPTGVPRIEKWKNFSMPGASGYAITPDAAKGLVKVYRPYWVPADNAINQFVVPIHIHTYLMGRNTLPEEGNVSMTKFTEWTVE
jgi:hypothetical protein